MYISIVKTENNRIAKYLEFKLESDALAHQKRHDGIVYNNVNNAPLRDLWIEGEDVSVVPVAEPQKQICISANQRVIFEALFEIANRLQVLEGKQLITKSQLKTWLESKLP